MWKEDHGEMSRKKRDQSQELDAHYKYDWFLDENPDVQERMERSKKEGLKEGEKKGEKKGKVEEAQAMVLEALGESYPTILPQARELVAKIQDAARLRKLTIQILRAPDEAAVLKLLHLPAA